MITVPKHDFLPEAPASPFKTVLLQELKNALLAKRLDRIPREPAKKKAKHPWGNKYIWARRARHPLILRAERWCNKEILNDLQTRSLIAHTRVGDLIHRIPARYWCEKYAGLSLGGRLFDINQDDTFPREFWGNSIFILEECANRWLLQRKIDQNNPAFPDRLRTRQLTRSKQMPPDGQIRAKLLELKASGWSRDQIAKKIRSTDFVKDRVAVEIQFGKYSFVAYDLFVKHMAFYVVGKIDVGIEVLPMKSLQREMSSGPSYYEGELYNLVREGRGAPPVPLILIGVAD